MNDKYIKAIYNGDIIEFYIMDKEPTHYLQNKEKQEIKEGMEWILGEEKDNRKESRREQTLRDSKNTMRRLAIRNFKPSETLFMTLTYRPSEFIYANDIDKADKHFREFIDTLRIESEQKVQYIAVREFTKKGVIHFHVLTDFKIDGDFSDPDEVDLRRWERDIAKVWSHGFVDIKVTNEIDNVGAYLSKYMSKEIGNDFFFRNKKYYLCSQGLKRPEILTGSVALDLYKAMNIKNEVYTNSYESEYLGTITYVEFNLNQKIKRKKKIDNLKTL